jgi:peptidoglycan/LPS O-acetylase OafA/YrhL
MRLKQLDTLRGIAVFLVLFHHWDDCAGLVCLPLNIARRAGWVGVDLFFVLSGFLIAGLLFNEHKKYQEIDFKRFFARRGMKIYPAFYVFLLTTILIPVVRGTSVNPRSALSEALFLQNYAGRLHQHTWSLAVEEHFYILLPLYLIWLGKRGGGFKALPLHFAVISTLVLGLRVIVSLTQPFNLETHAYPTHLRVDSLFFGVLLSYLYHYHAECLTFIKRYVWQSLTFGILLVAPSTLLGIDDLFMHTLGFTMLYLGFGIILLAALCLHTSQRMSFISFVGYHSYSIYLWHMFVRTYFLIALRQWFGQLPYAAETIFYFGSCVVLGVAMSKIVEKPALAIRERLFPARSRKPLASP